MTTPHNAQPPQKAKKKVEPYTPDWNRKANAIARDYCPPIHPCRDGGQPVIEGYCCHFCKSSNL